MSNPTAVKVEEDRTKSGHAFIDDLHHSSRRGSVPAIGPAGILSMTAPDETAFVPTVAVGTRSDAVPVSGQLRYCQAT